MFYENCSQPHFASFAISTVQNLKQSEVKHFCQINNYDLFQYLK